MYDILRVFEQLSSKLIFSESYKLINSQMREMKDLLDRHPYFSSVSVESLVKTINWLKTKFPNETILKNSHLTFYPK